MPRCRAGLLHFVTVEVTPHTQEPRMSAAPLAGVVIVNWKGLDDTLSCVDSCLQLDYPDYFLAIVDNGSGDGSLEALRTRFAEEPRVVVIGTERNLGFAGGNNVGIAAALERGAEYVWLLNNDTRVDTQALSALVSAAQANPSVGIWGSKIYFFEPPDMLWYAGGEVDEVDGHARHIGWQETDRGQYDGVHRTQYVTGCSMLASAGFLGEVGRMTEDYFLYWEEVDWCFRAAEHGYPSAVQPASLVWHKVSASTSGNPRLQARYETRNRLIFHWRHRRRAVPRIMLDRLRWGIHYYRTGDRDTASGVFSGVRDFLVGRTGPIAD